MQDVVDIVLNAIANAAEMERACIYPWDKIESLGLDSLSLLLVSMELEEELGGVVSLGGNDVARIETVQDLIDLVAQRLQGCGE